MKKALFLFFVLICSPVWAGESFVQKEFYVPENPKTVSDWLKQHPKDIAESTGCEWISKNGDKVRLKQDTDRGLMDFTVKETYTEKGSVYGYNSKLVEVHRGTLEDQATSFRLEPHRSGTLITVKMSAAVSNANAPAIRIGLNKSARGFQRLVEERFR